MRKVMVFVMCTAILSGSVLWGQAVKKVTIGVAIHGTDNEYWNQEAEGAKLFAASLPPGTADVQILTCEGDDAKQLDGIKSLIAAKGTDVVFYVDPSNAPNVAAIADVLEDAGVFWACVWHLPPGLDPTTYKHFVAFSSVDGVTQGYQIAVAMFKAFKTPGKGKILALQGQLGNNSAIERMQGLQKALKEYPGVQLVDTQVADWSPQRALNITQTWLAKYPAIDGIWSANDDMALGAVQALKQQKLNGKVKVAGVDGVSAAIRAIESGDMVATVANNGFLQGGYMTAYAYNAFIGKIDPMTMPKSKRLFNTKAEFVDKSNVAAFRKNFMSGKPVYDFNDLSYAIQGAYTLKK